MSSVISNDWKLRFTDREIAQNRVIFTGCFSDIAQHYEQGMHLVAISRTVPKHWRELKLNCLVPTGLAKLTGSEYDLAYMKILNELKPHQVLASLPDLSVLLCHEPPGFKCHRRIVAQWFEHYCKIEVPELGVSREQTPRYQDSKPYNAKTRKAAA